MSHQVADLTADNARVEIDRSSTSWQIILAAADGDAEASARLGSLRHPLLDRAWQLPAVKAKKDACWDALLRSRTVGNPEATEILAAFLAHDPVRTFDKLTTYRPVAVMVAEKDELTNVRPTRRGVPLGGRLIWFVTHEGGIGQVSWPKVATQERPNDREVLARVARLIVHAQIRSFRETGNSEPCGLCGNPIIGVSHVDHIVPFARYSMSGWHLSPGVSPRWWKRSPIRRTATRTWRTHSSGRPGQAGMESARNSG